jgi:hypothetical protein
MKLLAALCSSLLLLAGCPGKAAQPSTIVTGPVAAAVPTTRVVLPLSGLALDVPVRGDGVTYEVVGSWALSPDDNYYGRDVIEESSATGDLVGGTWVMIGYFDQRACDALFGEDEVITFGEPLEARTLGTTAWTLRGGIADLPGLGKLPAVRACTGAADQQKLIVYRFFVGEAETMTAAAMIDAFAASPAVAAIDAAFRARASDAVAPIHHPGVVNIGSIAAVRDIFLSVNGITMTLPDDGFLWRDPQADTEAGIDTFERAAPAIPELYGEIRRQPRTCREQLADLSPNNLAVASGISAAWIAGPTIDRDPDDEHIVCHDYTGGSVLVGFVGTSGDLSAFQPFLDALARAVD